MADVGTRIPPRDSVFTFRLRKWWVGRLLGRGLRLERRATRLLAVSETCNRYAQRHLRILREMAK